MINKYSYKLLRKNHATGIPRNVVYLDVETKTKEKLGFTHHRLKLAWTCSNRYSAAGAVISERWNEYKSTELLWHYIFSLARVKSTLYLFAHNAFFDLQSSDFFHYAYKAKWKLEFIWEEGLTFILVVRKDKSKIKIISSTNYFQTSLEALGKMFGYKKLKVDFDSVTQKELSKYCKRDVEILKKIMEFYFAFIIEHDLGKFSMSQASQAFRSFRHRFNTERICLHDIDEAKEIERLCYHGGRVEAFKWRKQAGGPFVTLDVNSMYPYIMREHYSPVQLIDILKKPVISKIKRLLDRFCIVAECEIKTDLPMYAVKRGHKLIFPTGHYIAYLTTHGLIEAIKRGHLVKVNIACVYRRAMLFNEYVDFFYGIKKQYKESKQKPLEHTAKIFLNALYGKFAQKKIITEEYEDKGNATYYKEKIFNLDTGIWIDETHLLGKIVVKMGLGEGPNSFVAVSAHITEGARMYLWSLFETVGLDKVIYCDTDSLMIRSKDKGPLMPLVDKYRLGALDFKKESSTLDIMGAKSYMTENMKKIKGIPKNAKQIGDYTYRYTTFFKQATHLNQRVTRSFLTRKTVKDVTPKYDKGVIQKNGSITPFLLSAPCLSLRQPLELSSLLPNPEALKRALL